MKQSEAGQEGRVWMEKVCKKGSVPWFRARYWKQLKIHMDGRYQYIMVHQETMILPHMGTKSWKIC